MVENRVEIDIKKEREKNNEDNFSFQGLIKEYEKGVDYEVDERGDYYTILSEKLKKVIWPNDNYSYDRSMVVIDREGKIMGSRFVSLKDNTTDSNKEFHGKVDQGGFRSFFVESKSISKDKSNNEGNVEGEESSLGGNQEQQNKELIKNTDHFLERGTKEVSKKSVVSWIVGAFIVCFSFIFVSFQ